MNLIDDELGRIGDDEVFSDEDILTVFLNPRENGFLGDSVGFIDFQQTAKSCFEDIRVEVIESPLVQDVVE